MKILTNPKLRRRPGQPRYRKLTLVQPQFKHFCKDCLPLGQYETSGHHYDLYACKHGGDSLTVIARFGDDGPQYTSGLAIARQFEQTSPKHPLVMALRRARLWGLLQ